MILDETAVEAAAEQPEVDWKSKAEEAERARSGILSELLEERRSRQQIAGSVEELRKAFLEREAANAPEEPQFDPQEKPVEYLDQRIAGIDQRVQSLLESNEQMRQQQAYEYQQRDAAARLQEISDVGRHSAERYKTVAPDYDNALGFLMDRGKAVARSQGVPEHNIPAYLLQQELAHNARCLQEGKDPAREAYIMAQQWGYRGQEAAPQPAAVSQSQAPRKPAMSLSTTSGARSKSRITASDFSQLPHHEQMAIAQDPRKWEQLGKTGYLDL